MVYQKLKKKYLNLDDNQFNGALSLNLSCSVNLTFVDIFNNFLIGKLPACIGSNTTNQTVLSSRNCLTSEGLEYQHPYSFCQKEALAVIPPNTNREGRSKGKLGLILGIVGGVVGAVLAVGLLILIIFRREKKKKKDDSFECDSFVLEKSSVQSEPAIDGRHVPQTMTMLSMGLPPYHVFTLEEMEDATNNFDPSNLAREGSQGQIYRGWLRDSSICLVKCLKLKQKHSQQSLQQHMEVISKLRHRHLVSVLGHCIVTFQNHHPNTASTVFIVLEHVANGSLRDHLTDWIKREYLKWPQRMRIAVRIARGIQFLHSGIIPGMYGSDLKIKNILLDKTLTSKISSYNISLPSKVGSESPLNGQDNPNMLSSIESAKKNDIYQLGVILLEVISGKPITSKTQLAELKLQLERGLAESPLRLRDAIDPSIRGTFAHE
ncbi:putative LRR receptor-like serine/threonine-protein kinase [Camellia lanceoleosa]|uniref:LRR receptor-like serine/threonine-protein kinase n=1 Tax=Camellia lanceoleosa TaxID=1840588 RepID=A0ACC0GQR7_9ERIC|nr:putative LRR receptor-like serine/threonine-protein kinase [Camellia lanceoleosa]